MTGTNTVTPMRPTPQEAKLSVHEKDARIYEYVKAADPDVTGIYACMYPFVSVYVKHVTKTK